LKPPQTRRLSEISAADAAPADYIIPFGDITPFGGIILAGGELELRDRRKDHREQHQHRDDNDDHLIPPSLALNQGQFFLLSFCHFLPLPFLF
jgi:hypothetical protein